MKLNVRPLLAPRFRPGLTALVAAAALGTTLALPCHALASAWQDAPNSLGAQIREAGDATEYRGEIRAFIDAQFQAMQGDDRAAAKDARDKLLRELSSTAGTDSFRSVLSSQIAQALPSIQSNDDAFVRINAAIVAEDAARRTGNSDLVGPVTTALGDASAGVSLWGLKSAESLLGQSLASNGDRDQLVPAVVNAVKKFDTNGPVAEEAYNTLMMRISDNPPAPNVLDRAVPVIIPAALDLMEYRLEKYRGEASEDEPVAQPAMPLAEVDGLILISHPATWQRIDPATRERAIKTMRDLMTAVLAAEVKADEADDVEARRELGTLRGRIASATQAIALRDSSNANVSAMSEAADYVKKLPIQVPSKLLQPEVEKLLTGIETAYPNIGDRPDFGMAPATPDDADTPDK